MICRMNSMVTGKCQNGSGQKRMLQFVKYCMVGVINTLVTLVTIFVCKSLLGCNPYFSNALGYVLGLINSFLWNKQWVFRSSGGYLPEATKFLGGFLLCYAVQFAVVYLLSESSFGAIELDIFAFVLSGYGIATLIGNVVYTLANFLYNRLITFRR